jgi:hypothetical protein
MRLMRFAVLVVGIVACSQAVAGGGESTGTKAMGLPALFL